MHLQGQSVSAFVRDAVVAQAVQVFNRGVDQLQSDLAERHRQEVEELAGRITLINDLLPDITAGTSVALPEPTFPTARQ